MEKADRKKLASGDYKLRTIDPDALKKSRSIKQKWDEEFGFRPKSIWNVKTKANFGQDKELQELLFPKTLASGSYVTGNTKEGYMLVPKKKSLSQFPLDLGMRLVKFYTDEFDNVFDPFAGMGERMQITAYLNRCYTGYDISRLFYYQRENLISCTNLKGIRKHYLRDSRNVDLEPKEFYDYILTSPPYYNVEVKAYGNEPEQLGNAGSYQRFLDDYKFIILQLYRILKPGRFCTFVVGNFRRGKKLTPFTEDTVKIFTDVGFDYHDNVVYEHSTFSAMFTKAILKYRRMGKTHENILTFRKPGDWHEFDE